MPIDPVTVATLSAVSSVLGIVDKVANQIQRFMKKEPEPAVEVPHKVQAVKETQTTIAVKREGVIVETITADDLKKLAPNDLALIRALESSMQGHYDVWVAVYPQRDQSVDPMVNAKVNRQLQDTAKKMCAELNRLFDFLKTLGKHLDDHYHAFRYVCQQIQS